jgi:demethylmenaquinone methyltransferase/2-methoxy-6-polyprenyl-1,4-benzoquinol methylase
MAERSAVTPHPPLPAYYDGGGRRREFVSKLFDTTAADYDWIVRAMSLGSGTRYRGQALRTAGLTPGMQVLDVACGTGPVSSEARKIVGPTGSVLGLDASFNMLKETRKRAGVPVIEARAENLPVRDASFDFLSMGYALRHVEDLTSTFLEYRRALRPGGRLLVLEMTRPRSRVQFRFAKFYLFRVVPLLSGLFSRSTNARTLMKYYWDTIEHCVPPGTILSAMYEAGFEQVERRSKWGLLSEYVGLRPLES